VDTNIGIEMETDATEPVTIEPVEIEHIYKEIEVGNARTVFIEIEGKVIRRSGRQARERRKVITY
jgi:hypothetical protein